MQPISPTERMAGFTLIEILAVLTVIAILTVAAAGHLPRSTLPVDHVALQVTRDLRAVRFEAVTTGRDIVLGLDADGSADVRPIDVPAEIELRLLGVDDAPVETIVFFGAGGASGGAVEIQRGTARERVGVDWLTGRVGR